MMLLMSHAEVVPADNVLFMGNDHIYLYTSPRVELPELSGDKFSCRKEEESL
jgi:hypothetical protein